MQKWFVLSTLTGRYVGSPESVMSRDIRLINEKGFINFFYEIEASVLSDTFWDISLPQNLETTSTNSPAFNTFLAAQINLNCNSLFMHGTMISDLINISGDVHHIFPKAYLKNNGIDTCTLQGVQLIYQDLLQPVGRYATKLSVYRLNPCGTKFTFRMCGCGYELCLYSQ